MSEMLICLLALTQNVEVEENFETDILLIFEGTLHFKLRYKPTDAH
jgi:hypothetical protein